MPKPPYHVWINDDEDYILDSTKELLEDRFPGVLETRTHYSYTNLQDTISDWENHQNQRPQSSDIHPPGLVIQDYNFGYPHEESPKYCLYSLRLLTETYPSAKIIVSTTDEYFEEAQKMLNDNGWKFPVTGKVFLDDEAASLVERIITDGLR